MDSQCLCVRRSLALTGLSSLSKSVSCRPALQQLSLVRSVFRVDSMASSDDFGLHSQPAFKFEQADLMADAPSLIRTCADFDWKAQASELRALAQLSLSDKSSSNQAPFSNPSSKQSGEGKREDDADTWFAAGLTLATATLLQFSSVCVNAFAAEAQQTETAEAASRAPAWLIPTLLAFPVVSYVIFYVYRSQVNPDARVMDWMFGVAASVIIANLVLISTLGVRLY